MKQTISETGITRKCARCGQEEHVTRENINIVTHKNQTYHTDCFIEMASERAAKKNSRSSLWQEYLNSVPQMQAETRRKILERLDKDALNNYLLDKYDEGAFSSRFWTVLADIGNGIYKSKRCKPMDFHMLLELWKFSEKSINETAQYNKSRGKEMSGEAKAKYDLTIVVGNYSKFKAHKEKSDSIAAQEQEAKQAAQRARSIDFEKLSQQAAKKEVAQELDILSLMDEIFS